MGMQAILAALTRVAAVLGIDTLGGIFTGLSLNQGPSFQTQVEKLTAQVIAKQHNIDNDDAEKLLAAGGVSMLMGAGYTQKDAIAQYLKRGGNRKDVEEIVRGFKPISVKNREKIISLIKTEGAVKTTTLPRGMKFPTGTGLLGKIVMPIILVMMFTQQVGDWFVFFPGSLKRILSWLGLDVNIPEAPPEVLGESKPGPALAILLDTLSAQGVVGLRHPGTGNALDLTVDNLAVVLEAIEQKVAAAGKPTFSNNVLPELEQYKIYSSGAKGTAGKATVAQQASAVASNTTGSSSSKSFDTQAQPRTIIRMVEENKPEQFLGTLFSAKVGDMRTFERHIDDEITDENDLLEDAKINLTNWLASFPGRLGYSVKIVNGPVDHEGTKQSGIWAVLTMHMTRLNGTIQPIDTILLGPVTPATRLKLSKQLTTIEAQIPKLLTGEVVRQINIPRGSVDIFDNSSGKAILTPVAGVQQLAKQATNEEVFVPIEPTAAQIAARENPTPVQVRYPLDGIFTTVGDFGNALYKRHNNRWHVVDLTQALLGENRGAFGNAGGQGTEAKRRLKLQYGIDWDALPSFNFGDMQSDSTITNREPIRYTDITQFLAFGKNTPADRREDTLNA